MTRRKIRNIEKNIDNIMGVNQLFRTVDPKNNSNERGIYENSKNNEISCVKSFNLKLPKHMHTYVKKMAIDTEKSINDLLIEAISNYYNI